jgi:hypothetical protein
MEFCLNNKNIREFLKPKNIKKFELNEADSNFWNFFIAWKGVAEYEKLRLFKQTKIREQQLKIEFQEKLAKTKLRLKSVAIENLTQSKTTLETIIALAALEKINILFVNKRTYYLCENEDAPFAIFGDIDTVTKEDMRLEGKIQRPTVNCGLKPISSYKLKDLQDLHNLTGLTLKKTKKELYDEITEYMK